MQVINNPKINTPTCKSMDQQFQDCFNLWKCVDTARSGLIYFVIFKTIGWDIARKNDKRKRKERNKTALKLIKNDLMPLVGFT